MDPELDLTFKSLWGMGTWRAMGKWRVAAAREGQRAGNVEGARRGGVGERAGDGGRRGGPRPGRPGSSIYLNLL